MTATRIHWSISDADRSRFTSLSGDTNPIHDDPVAARRLQGGHLLVHGAHVVLRTVADAATAGLVGGPPARLSATFRHGIRPDDALTTSFGFDDDGTLRAAVAVDVWPAAEIAITGRATPAPDLAIADRVPLAAPDDRSFAELAGLTGEVELGLDVGLAGTLLGPAVAVLGPLRVAEIASVSRIVGTRAPGLRSMSSRYEIDLVPATTAAPVVRYRVEQADERVRRVRLAIVGPTLRATVTAFSPHGPVDQRAALDRSPARPRPAEFAGRRVLVVGGSRGLGELAARLLVAGGADVRISYRVGAAEASAIARELGVRAHRLDVGEGDVGRELGALDGWQPTHLAHFATPPTSDGMAGVFSEAFRDRLLAIQVDGLEQVLARLPTPPLVGVLWPSTSALDRPRPGTGELAAVKRAGEARCRALEARRPGLRIHTPRLSHLLTDQTTALVPVAYGDAPGELLGALRVVTA